MDYVRLCKFDMNWCDSNWHDMNRSCLNCLTWRNQTKYAKIMSFRIISNVHVHTCSFSKFSLISSWSKVVFWQAYFSIIFKFRLVQTCPFSIFLIQLQFHNVMQLLLTWRNMRKNAKHDEIRLKIRNVSWKWWRLQSDD